MAALSDLQPANVFKYFQELCNIPHGSGNIRAISDYLCAFAKDRGLKFVQDEAGNVIIYKPASGTGTEKTQEPLILQAHMDMVAVSVDDRDMTAVPIVPLIDGDHIYADGTSLGGDDGIGVAYIMALLASDDLAHPPLEAVITTDEETGMDGARALDPALISGRRMINLDSEEEGHILAGCAGGARVYISHGFGSRQTISGQVIRIDITGCAGGHSGNEIHKRGANANVIAGRLLNALCGKYDVDLIDIGGGEVDNAIPKFAYMTLAFSDVISEAEISDEIRKNAEMIKSEFTESDPDMKIETEVVPAESLHNSSNSGLASDQTLMSSAETTRHIAAMLCELPNGVMAMSPDVEGLVETSLNLGVISCEPDAVKLQYSVRSSIEEDKASLIGRLRAVADKAGADTEVNGDYPGWKYQKDSALRDCLEKVYKDMYGKEAVTEAIHAGLECGFFSKALPGLDCVSIGPDMKDIHTTSERLSISSTARLWDYLCRVINELC
ncbi:MAG: aminoacyl-histidine dipeptidase [Lachnospiraceae bacterium]|nr:aminoacyl-histidine dipeptidase [Lachnospiraceae bacterium]